MHGEKLAPFRPFVEQSAESVYLWQGESNEPNRTAIGWNESSIRIVAIQRLIETIRNFSACCWEPMRCAHFFDCLVYSTNTIETKAFHSSSSLDSTRRNSKLVQPSVVIR